MRIVLLLCAILVLQSIDQLAAQNIHLNLRNVPPETVLSEIKKQTDYRFVYTREQLEGLPMVSVQLRRAGIERALRACFPGGEMDWTIAEKVVVLKRKTAAVAGSQEPAERIVKGRVLTTDDEPMEGVTVRHVPSGRQSMTNPMGVYEMIVPGWGTLVFSHAGFDDVEHNAEANLLVQMQAGSSLLDEAIVMAYGKTSRRLNTGNIGRLSSTEISKQPVTNPLAALQGRIPGVLIKQSSGVPGSSFSVEIRGRSSIDQSLSRNDPLIVIDGVPFEAGNLPANQLRSSANKPLAASTGGLSPLNTLNPASIESIEVLKDADATAIYGSRGANGVILITTKTAKPGATALTASVQSGVSRVSRTMDMLNTQQYLEMRREAFKNDARAMATTSAPDLLLWDTTRYTDFKKLLIGNRARFFDAQLNLSGGTAFTRFFIGAGYHHESNVFSDDLNDRRVAVNTSLTHTSSNQKFGLNFSAYFASDHNKLIQTDLTQYINIPPHFKWRDSLGRPNWSERGYSISSFPFSIGTTPLAELEKKYQSINENLTSNLLLSYRISKGLTFRTNLGYNSFGTDENSQTPKSALDPAISQLAFASFSKGASRNWIVEPQLEYDGAFKFGRLNILAGSTWQERIVTSTVIHATNYRNDLMLSSPKAAGNTAVNDSYAQYRYTAFFGRVRYNYVDRYIVNLSARRDGSSRFGPGSQFANFGAVGAAWLFTKETFMQWSNRILSFGKLRFSYGITGNDQIGDYKFLNLWNSTTIPYQGNSTLEPVSLFNPNYEWEKNKKLEAAMELGFFKDRLLISAAYYRNRSSNQLVNYLLPDQTGFSTVTRNLPAVVENSGVELVVTTKNIDRKGLSWSTDFTLTIPRNKLVSFPGLVASSYQYLYKEGHSLSTPFLLGYRGLNKELGIYTFEDVDKDGQISFPNDYSFGKPTDPSFFGGLQNNLKWKGFDLSIFLDFRKQIGKNYLGIIGGNHPGLPINQPTIVLDHWSQPSDDATIQKYTGRLGGPAGLAASNLGRSDGIFSDASFVRLKNISFGYSLAPALCKKVGLGQSRLYVLMQNAAVFTNYKGSDPETQDFYVLPPLRTIVGGISIQF